MMRAVTEPQVSGKKVWQVQVPFETRGEAGRCLSHCVYVCVCVCGRAGHRM